VRDRFTSTLPSTTVAERHTRVLEHIVLYVLADYHIQDLIANIRVPNSRMRMATTQLVDVPPLKSICTLVPGDCLTTRKAQRLGVS